ncbi:hypothetical protein E3Q22_04028 [Wallemia mellicola]|uniref:Exosome complex component CSL4 C-terminal domain-containing protein n=2 Tax=Wallemia mellicola TaxID=1708541 RepID=A0A4T0PVJ1_9BASI|nr:hypothetical protein WALSEDRAFT_58311 [Wallemia mellicola CBS 633.66]TIB72846.1 hypothetical protein E3Q24_01512 [Wallemia mellicola]EIM20284.1 hypothetical protein WALSEDRAFT_58311 [Wallemia mellicola CBS 633.66]TIB75362.1 hypothetical protein E3Q22_04028 [Wallemia mellicola]TIB86254.1 hypothetical protein E3Q19_03964 [Wallemia mellicola]TIB99235.1 hypothetical protein E3Q18_01727 [Wallemia mellicola]|eukprot:XP_006959772.1 hypothetical protein WALSEDRAFT_58311 [Wallemia mellicola CBS 633.66]
MIVLPGQPVSDNSDKIKHRESVYERSDKLISSTIGKLSKSEDSIRVESAHKNAQPLPEIDSEVLATVVRLNSKQATLQLDVIDGVPCTNNSQDSSFQAILRSQDVRQTDKDRVKMYNCVRPGDIVRASVISLGDAKNYYLSTAKNELGVVFATSEYGNPMIPISWESMKDIQTDTIEQRKCAKPTPL